MAPAALVIALVAAAAAGWALLRPAPGHDSPAAEPPARDPKTNACNAFQTVTSAVALQTHGNAMTSPAALQDIAMNALADVSNDDPAPVG